jgi:cytochrome c peroxidase
MKCAAILLAGMGSGFALAGTVTGAATAGSSNAALSTSTATATAFYADSFDTHPTAAAMSRLGRALFSDPSLSASGKLACASCHDPKAHFGPPNERAVQRGGDDGRKTGLRAVPSLMYGQNIPPFTEHYTDDEEDDSIDQGPAGGHDWDGRAQSVHVQALEPLLSPLEMANANAQAVTAALRRTAYFHEFEMTFGKEAMRDDANLLRAALLAFETYQQEPQLFYPYTSKYDAWLRGQATLSAQELRGLAAFNDPERGNCARCHPSAVKGGGFPQFTDFGYAAIGVPRNPAIAANADPHYYDLGLCGPLRTDLIDKTEYCGMFRTPSLRNVATRRVFFHNGRLHRLVDVLRWYAERDLQPQHWYPKGVDGRVRRFDDLPERYHKNVDSMAPFDRRPGDAPALSSADIDDMLVFLATLSDGYRDPATARALLPRNGSRQAGGVSPEN